MNRQGEDLISLISLQSQNCIRFWLLNQLSAFGKDNWKISQSILTRDVGTEIQVYLSETYATVDNLSCEKYSCRLNIIQCAECSPHFVG